LLDQPGERLDSGGGLASAGHLASADVPGCQVGQRGAFSYIEATLTGDTTLRLCRLRYTGSAHQWQFAIYRASHDDYGQSVFFTGLPTGTCQDAFDTACGPYLNDPTAWT
jgi:hypothetical protein